MRTVHASIVSILFAGTAIGITASFGAFQQGATPAPAAPPQATAKPAETPAAATEPAPFQVTSPEQKAVVDGVAAFSKAYSEANVKGLVEFFADDASIVDPSGTETRGKPAIAEMYAAAFQELPGLKLESTVEDIKFLTADVAKVNGQSRLSAASGDATEFTRFSTLLVRHDGKWQISEIREYPAPPEDVAPGDRLRELEWMVGDWVDESEQNKISSSVRWADNDSYLIREYSIEIAGERASSGTMFIGWDPQSAQIKSWLFDSNGGHGEGLWTRTGETEWVVKAQGVLRDGRTTSATQIHTILNKDSVKTSSIDRIIGGTVAPDITDVVMVRKPPQPTSAPEAKPATATPR